MTSPTTGELQIGRDKKRTDSTERPSSLLDTDKLKIREFLTPVLIELDKLLRECAVACRHGNFQEIARVQTKLLEKFKSEGCHVVQVQRGNLTRENPARLGFADGHWMLLIRDEIISIPTTLHTKELIHELGALLLLKRIEKKLNESGEKLNLEDVKQMEKLKNKMILESNPVMGLTHVLDSSFNQMIKEVK